MAEPAMPLARERAYAILLDLQRGRGTLADRLAHADPQLEARERRFLREVLLGTLRRRGALDFVLARASRRPLAAIEPHVLAALRLGAYQILHMRVATHAAVAESVALVASRGRGAKGFVNAVLRRVVRDGPPPFPDPHADPLGWLTSEGSLPDWLARRWLARFGADTAVARTRVLLDPPPQSFRLNPRLSREAAGALLDTLAAVPLQVPSAYLAARGVPADFAARGELYLQDEGSQLVARLVAEGRPATTLDACAAPGGKALLVADLGSEEARVIALERSARRLRAMRHLVALWGNARVSCVAGDALRPPFARPFDAVLLDAPCSGLGTLARHPDIRWRAVEDDLARQAARQRRLLATLATLVAEGGVLVYSTCSTEPEENESVVFDFLSAHPHFARAPLPSWATAFGDVAGVRTLPEVHGGDAFFAAPLRRLG